MKNISGLSITPPAWSVVFTSLVAGLLVAGAAPAPTVDTDIREFSVGMPLSTLPPHGYLIDCVPGLAKAEALKGWADYARCPVDKDGLREIRFRYGDNGEYETKVVGQPMQLSLFLGQDGTVDAIRMETDPTARLFLRKRAFIFGEQVKDRYGEPGWVCTVGQPQENEEPVGGMFVREHCDKTVGIRHLVMDRELFRNKDQSLTAFISRTVFTVSLVNIGKE